MKNKQSIIKIASSDTKRMHSFQQQAKNLIKSNRFIINLFKKYDVPMQNLQNLKIVCTQDLGDKNAKTRKDVIFINKRLFMNSKSNSQLVHCLIHELCHWLTAQKQKQCYFSDPEQLQAFSLGMAWQVNSGKTDKDIQSIYYPIVQKHFKDQHSAKTLFNKLLQNAKKMSQILG